MRITPSVAAGASTSSIVRGARLRRARTRAAIVVAVLVVALSLVVGMGRPDARRHPAPPSRIDTLLLQFQPRAQAVMASWRDLLAHLPADRAVLVGVASEDEITMCRGMLGPPWDRDARIEYVVTGAAMTPWARDDYIAVERGASTHLLVPMRQEGPAVRGGRALPSRLRALGRTVEVVPLPFHIEGGDVVLAPSRALVGVTTIHAAARAHPRGRQGVLAVLEERFGRPVVVVADGRTPPWRHIDMFLSVLDDRTVALADPRLAEDLFGDGMHLDLEGLGRFDAVRQFALTVEYDHIARQLRGEGFRVVRVPILHAEPDTQGRAPVLTYCNVLLDAGPEGPIVYLPRYGVPRLDQRAASVWRGLGYAVRSIDVREASLLGGAVHCLTSEIRRPTRP